jgi:hypothetical protein
MSVTEHSSAEGLNRGEVVSAEAAQRRGAVTGWALFGALWGLIAAQAIVRWIISDQFEPVLPAGPDVFAQWRLISLRVLEVVSFTVLLGFVWFCVVRPRRRDGRLSLDGRLVISGVFGAIADACLNLQVYLFAWNAHAVNLGAWTAFMPFHNPETSTRYAEALLWGVPMYIYLNTGAAIVGCRVVLTLRARFPRISNVSAFAALYLAFFVGALLLENIIIRVTQAYAYAQTPASVTLFAGSLYQFPIYESVFVAAISLAYTVVRMSALDSTDGVSCIERGYQRWRPALQEPVRLLAVVGFGAAAFLVLYHLPLNWLGIIGDSHVVLPSYMLAH